MDQWSMQCNPIGDHCIVFVRSRGSLNRSALFAFILDALGPSKTMYQYWRNTGLLQEIYGDCC